MDKRSCLYIFLLGLFFLLCLAVFSQKTLVYTNPDASLKPALELFQKQKFGAAQKQFSKIIRRYSEQPNSLLRTEAEYYSALCAVELFNKDAELQLKSFIVSHPESPRIPATYFHLGKYAYRKKQYNKVLQWFTKVDVYDLNNEELSEFYFKRGYSYFDEDSAESAKKDFYEIKDIDNKYAAPATYYYAHISYLEKNYQTALQHFRKLQQHENFGAIVPYYIAQILFLQQKYDSAIAYTAALLDSTSKRQGELTKILGESYYRTNRYKQALPYLKKYKEFAQGNLTRSEWYQLGYACYQNELFGDAIPFFTRAIGEQDSLSQNAYYHLAGSSIKLAAGERLARLQAKNSFELAYKLDFDKTITEDALFNYSKLCYELSFSPFGEAILALNDYISRYPASARIDECYKYLVNVYLSTKNYKEAMKSIENIQTLNEEMKGAYQKIALLYGLQLYVNNHLQESIIYLNKSLLYPSDPALFSLAHYWKGEAFYYLSEKAAITFGLDSAIAEYKIFLSAQGAINHNEFFSAHYNLGYACFKKENYTEANVWFRKYVALSANVGSVSGGKSEEPKEKINDAYLRIGDNFFMTKNYLASADYYDEALKSGERDADYALYQKSLALGLTGKREMKAKTLTDFLKNYSGKSKYEAAAKYELASTYLQLEDEDNALAYYKKVVAEHPQCSYTPRALLQTGLLQTKKKKYDDALATLDKVLSSYPKTSSAFEAINSLKDIYRAKGDMDGYEEKLKTIPYAAVSLASLDSGNYAVAYDYYDKSDCENAVKYFNKYLSKYPDGIFITEVMFYKAECDYKNKNYDAALGGYQYVTDQPHNKFTETSLLKGAALNFRNKNYQNALNQYIRLAEVAEYPANVSEGKIGTMRCRFLLKNFDDAIVAAQQVLQIEKISSETKAECHLLIGKSAAEKQDFDLAMSSFSNVSAFTTSEKSAEAKYLTGYIQFVKGNHKESQKTIFELINQQPGYDYWIGKGFILLADNYSALNDFFNAKYALQSLIDKSANAELVMVAKEKLNRIIEMEKLEEEKKELKKTEETQIPFLPDNPKDTTLYKEEGK